MGRTRKEEVEPGVSPVTSAFDGSVFGAEVRVFWDLSADILLEAGSPVVRQLST
jgi:hypothetical protein